jgi:hypothetical protein
MTRLPTTAKSAVLDVLGNAEVRHGAKDADLD